MRTIFKSNLLVYYITTFTFLSFAHCSAKVFCTPLQHIYVQWCEFAVHKCYCKTMEHHIIHMFILVLLLILSLLLYSKSSNLTISKSSVIHMYLIITQILTM